MAKQSATTEDNVVKQNQTDPIAKANKELAAATERKKRLIQYYKEESKRWVSISPMYRPYFANVMTVTINGISIRIPVDGSRQEIPATFADEVERRIRNVDAVILRQKKMADIPNNFESAPGEMKLF